MCRHGRNAYRCSKSPEALGDERLGVLVINGKSWEWRSGTNTCGTGRSVSAMESGIFAWSLSFKFDFIHSHTEYGVDTGHLIMTGDPLQQLEISSSTGQQFF